jgi:hypothetical protein
MRLWSNLSEFCAATGNMSRRNKKKRPFNSLDILPKFYANINDRQDRLAPDPAGRFFPQGYPLFWWICSGATKNQLFDGFVTRI